MKKYAEAETCFKFVLNYFKENNENNFYFTQAAKNLGGLYIQMERYEEGEILLKKALEINKLIIDPKHLSYRLNLSKLVILYIIENKLEDAEKLLVELFELQLNLDYLEHTALEYLHTIASRYFDKGLYEKVEKISLKTYQLYQKLQLTNSIEYCELLNLLATSYIYVGKLEEAAKLMREAIDIEQILFPQFGQSRIVDSSDISIGLTISNSFGTFGMVLWNLAQKITHPAQLSLRRILLLDAERCTKSSLDLCQVVSEQSNDTKRQYMLSAIHNNLGLILEDLEKYSEAEISYKIALRLRREQYGNEHYLVGQSLLNLAACYDWQKKNNDAVEHMLSECKTIWENLLEPNHPEIIHCYEHLAKFYSRTRKFKEAIHYYQKTIKNCRARQANNISFYQQKLEECIKQSLKLKPKKSNHLSKKPKGFG
jgi:tetratricopeptide (TPR) repeat protein